MSALPAPSLLRLIWLASPALPVGGFSYSEGLEAAVDAALVTDEAQASDWLLAQLQLSQARSDLPVLAQALQAADIAFIGIRSVDAEEKAAIARLGLRVWDMRAIDEHGMRHAMNEALQGADADTHLHVSFDLDALDPVHAPGVSTGVPGGLTYREMQLCMEMIADTGCLGSLDVMEINPARDVRNRTAELAVQAVCSLLGAATLTR